MIAAAHVMAGLVAGAAAVTLRSNAAKLVVACGLGLVSHVALDSIPHSDYGSLSRSMLLCSVAVEISATLGLGWYLLRSHSRSGMNYAILAGLAGAMVPDVKFARYFLPEPAAMWVTNVGNRFHRPFHAAPTSVAVGLTFEIVSTVLLLGVLLLLLRRDDR